MLRLPKSYAMFVSSRRITVVLGFFQEVDQFVEVHLHKFVKLKSTVITSLRRVESMSDDSSALHDILKPLAVIAIFVGVALLSQMILGELTSFHLISSGGRVRAVGVGVYWDTDCISPVSYLDWGAIEPTSARNLSVFIRNEGEMPVHLFLNSTNWDPDVATEIIALSWDYSNELISPNTVIKVILTLSCAQITSGLDFRFDVIIGVNG